MSTPLLRWRIAYWLRVAPGTTGLAILAAAPLLLALPLGRIPLFDGWLAAATTLGLLYAFALAPILGRDSGRPEPSLVWLFQKGASIPDHLAARWCLDAALGTALIAWWCAIWLLVDLAIAHQPAVQIAVTGAAMLLAFLIGTAFLFLAAAAGSARGTDLLFGLALISLLQPFVAPALPPPLRVAAGWVLPPIPEAIRIGTDATGGDWVTAAASLARIAAFVTVCTAAGALLLRRWRPGTGGDAR